MDCSASAATTIFTEERSKTGEWRWLLWFLILSALAHLWAWHYLDQLAQNKEPPAIIKQPPPTIAVQFYTLPKPHPPTSSKSQPDSNPIISQQTINNQKPADKPKTKTAQPSSSEIIPRKPIIDETSNVASPKPSLDLSKVLEDTRQVAKEIGERGDNYSDTRGPSFDRRKLQVDPQNLKAPNVAPSQEIERYELANGYQRSCRAGSDGKKHCLTRMKDDPNTPFNANIDMHDIEAPPKPGEELAKRFKEALGQK